MKSGKRTISKTKGVEICAELMFTGSKAKEIVQECTQKYGVSVSCVDKWMKAARPIVAARQEQAEKILAREMEAEIAASAKRLNLTRERILEEYAKIAFFDIRKIYTVDGGLKPISEIDDDTAGGMAGVESYDEKQRDSDEVLGTTQKVKVWDKRAALDSICKVLGYNAPEKKEIKADLNLSELPITFE
jgi:hypothetical protein